VLAAVVLLVAGAEGVAEAEASPSAPQTPDAQTPSPAGAPEGDRDRDPAARTMLDLEKAPPPPTNVVYLQYGVAFTAEVVSSAGPICDNAAVPCILGPGGGIAVRAGWRGAGSLYLGGAYELSKQDPNKLYRLALLQQARFEGRYYFVTGRDVEPYAAGGLGVAGYGDEWAIDTWGPAGCLGGGIEVQITRRTVVGLAAAYRVLWFKSFTDTSGADRGAGLAQLVGLDLVLEQRDPIFTRTGQAAQ
jgi:hypothetical protein